jgi:hypothetical protein
VQKRLGTTLPVSKGSMILILQWKNFLFLFVPLLISIIGSPKPKAEEDFHSLKRKLDPLNFFLSFDL